MMRLLLCAVASILLFTIASPVTADTDEQNAIEAACMFMLLADSARYGALPLAAKFDAYAICAAAWWVSWLPEAWQAMWWRWQYDRTVSLLAEAAR